MGVQTQLPGDNITNSKSAARSEVKAGLTSQDVTSTANPVLFFIKTQSTGSNTIEVHGVDQNSGYENPFLQTGTVFREDDGDNGTWDIDSANLYFIKTKNCASGFVELHQASSASGYSEFAIQTPTAFTMSDVINGVFQVDGGSLYYIKTKNTDSGNIEVYRIDPNDWNTIAASSTTDCSLYSQTATGRGTWRISGGDLWRITQIMDLKVFQWKQSEDYQESTEYTTTLGEYGGGYIFWDIGPGNDVYEIQVGDVAGDNVVLTVSTFESGFQDNKTYPTWFKQTDAFNGVWTVRLDS